MGQATRLWPAIAEAIRYRPLVWTAAAAILGMALTARPQLLPWISLAAALPALAWRTSRTPLAIAVACVLGGYGWAYLAVTPAPDDISRLRGQYVHSGGVIIDDPEFRSGIVEATVAVDHVALSSGARIRATGRLRLCASAEPGSRLPLPGERMLFAATITALPSAANPGEYSRSDRLRRQGVFAEARVRRASDWSTGPPVGGWRRLLSWTASIRRSFTASMSRLVPSVEPALLSGIIFGGRGGLPDGIADMFSATGTSHVLAASGMNVGVIAIFVGWLLPATLVPRRLRALLILWAVGAYTLASGASPSVARAALMVTVLTAGDLLGRESDPASAIAAAALCVLALQPGDLWDPGFQMSFAIVGLFVTVGPVVDRLRWNPEGVSRLVTAPANLALSAIAWSLVAIVAVAPLTMLYFGSMPLTGILANAIVSPLVVLLDVAGLALWPVYVVAPMLALALSPICLRWPISVVLGAVSTFSRLPAATLSPPPPSPGLVAAYYGLLGLLLLAVSLRLKAGLPVWRRSGQVYLLAASWTATWILMLLPVSAGRPLMEVTFLSVGQGDAAVIRGPSGQVVAIDAGRHSEANDQGRSTVVPFLRRFARGHVDLLAISHADDDHSGGAASVMGMTKVDRLMAPEAFYRAATLSTLSAAGTAVGMARSRGVLARVACAGTAVVWPDGMRLEVVGPEATAADVAGNDGSLVLRATFGSRSVLFTGDAGYAEEQAILSSGPNIQSDVLKLGHHGSRASTSAEFLHRVHPSEAIASVGDRNTYGHPNSEVVDRLREQGVRLWRTDTQGAITVMTDGKAMWVRTSPIRR